MKPLLCPDVSSVSISRGYSWTFDLTTIYQPVNTFLSWPFESESNLTADGSIRVSVSVTKVAANVAWMVLCSTHVDTQFDFTFKGNAQSLIFWVFKPVNPKHNTLVHFPTWWQVKAHLQNAEWWKTAPKPKSLLWKLATDCTRFDWRIWICKAQGAQLVVWNSLSCENNWVTLWSCCGWKETPIKETLKPGGK